MHTTSSLTQRWLPKARFDELLRWLADRGYEVIGPTLADGAIVYAPIRDVGALPIGWGDLQKPGEYRLSRRNDEAWFGFAVGPHSWKRYLFPPRLRLWSAQRTRDGFEVKTEPASARKRAFLGVRSCELHAIAVQDRTLMSRDGRPVDPHYESARSGSFVIAVECQDPAGVCFCVSMGTGPAIEPERIPLPLAVAHGADERRADLLDLALTELAEGFVVRAFSPEGAEAVEALNLGAATDEQITTGMKGVAAAAARMGRVVETTDLQALLHRNQEHPRWDDVAGRCLACTNCTMVCPTCFCMSVEEVTDLTLDSSARERVWDSCFNPEFGAVHGGNFRSTIRGRYRQWLTHKFASWFDQFGVSGCVGCGRCLTWCPVGIDVTEELNVIRATDGQTLTQEATP